MALHTNTLLSDYVSSSMNTIKVSQAVQAETANEAVTSTYSQTASYYELKAGPGINVNSNEISSSILSVNGNFPDSSGNISTTLSTTITGDSSSLAAYTSSTNVDGLVWVVTGDADPNKNGVSYIWVSSSQEWNSLASLDTTTADARYLMLNPQSQLTGDLNLGGNNITNGNLQGTASVALSSGTVIKENITVIGTTSNPTIGSSVPVKEITLYDDGSGYCTVNLNLRQSTSANGSTNGLGNWLFKLPGGYKFNTSYHYTNSQIDVMTGGNQLACVIPGSNGYVVNATTIWSQVVVVPYTNEYFRVMTLGVGDSQYQYIRNNYFAMYDIAFLGLDFRFRKL